MPLVLVGPAGRWARELPAVTVTGEVTDDELAAIYTGAHALVFPSDEEGFGLPPVEALACGTPVVACDVPALREVLDGRAILRDVDDLDGLLAAAESVRRPPPAPPPWTWRDAAEATWNVYAQAVSDGRLDARATGRRWRSAAMTSIAAPIAVAARASRYSGASRTAAARPRRPESSAPAPGAGISRHASR